MKRSVSHRRARRGLNLYNALALTEPASNSKGPKEPDAPPPVLGTWSRFYAVVVANTILIYLLLILFSAYAR